MNWDSRWEFAAHRVGLLLRFDRVLVLAKVDEEACEEPVTVSSEECSFVLPTHLVQPHLC